LSIDAEQMLWELEANYLEVVLIPAREQRHAGHCVRAVQYQNCEWYRKFCASYSSGRKGAKTRTRIKRRETINALQAILNGQTSGVYVERLLEIIADENRRLAAEKRRMNVRTQIEVVEWMPF
jgi:hypothetical protein